MRNTRAKIHSLDWSNAPGTKEVLVYPDAYRDLSFAQERNRSDLFLWGVMQESTETMIAEGRMDEQRGWRGRGVALGHFSISRGFSAEAPLVLSSGELLGKSWGRFLINRRYRVLRGPVSGTPVLVLFAHRRSFQTRRYPPRIHGQRVRHAQT